jgi:hypothetical protein
MPASIDRTLDSAPPGAHLDYYLSDNVPTAFVLSGTYQSGWRHLQCRLGRIETGAGMGGAPTVYVFCRQDGRWYEMPPVVVSGP